MITVEKLNESTLRVTSEDFGIEQEIDDFFKFRPAGYQFAPTFKAKVWDGYIRLFSVHRKTLPYGLLPYLQKFAKTNDYPITLLGNFDEYPSTEGLDEYVESLNTYTGGKKIVTRDYQFQAIEKALQKGKCITRVPTGGGKSFILYCYVRWLLERGEKIILIVPTTSLVNQMYSDFEDYSSHNGWSVEDNCHKLYSGLERTFEKPVLISTWQTIHSMGKQKSKEIKEFFEQWTVAIGDEAHKFASNALISIMGRLVNARYRLGTTGTVQDEKVSKLNLEGSFGPIFDIITTKQLIDNKQLVDLRIKCLILQYPEEIKKLFKGAEYQKEMEYITSNEKRHRFIVNLAKATKGNTLVLFQFVERHGKKLYELAKSTCGDRPIFYISGEISADEREEIRKTLSTHDDAIVFASIQTTATGVNIPSIENIIFSSPSKSKIQNLQSIGRGLRLKDGKTKCNLFDVADDLSYKSKMNHTLKHLRERIEIYSSEQFEFDITTVPFNPT
jgi:superfamily II DNA or RNA helicase